MTFLFGNHPSKIGTIQRQLAWPLCKDVTHKSSPSWMDDADFQNSVSEQRMRNATYTLRVIRKAFSKESATHDDMRLAESGAD